MSPPPPPEAAVADVLVAGGGPAGWSVARACAEQGLAVALADPRPDAVWRHTYGAWEHELPPGYADVVAARGRGTAIAVRTHDLTDVYALLDTPALQERLRHDDVRVLPTRVTSADDDGAWLADGTRLRAPVVVDATGAAQALAAGGRPVRSGRDTRAEQTAYGVFVDESVARRVTGGRTLFMDWRPVHGEPGWPTFLYAVPLGGGRVLLEETSLARRPGLPLPVLRRRLERRLRAHGLATADIPTDRDAVEKVRFPVDSPRRAGHGRVVAVGAATPLVHPATGFSLARGLDLAPRLAAAVAEVLGGSNAGGADAAGSTDAAARARHVVDGPRARAVRALRHRGLDVMLRMPPTDVPVFFDRFFDLPTEHRRAYLGAHDDVTASLAAMLALWQRLPHRLRLHLVRGSLLGGGPPLEAPREGEGRQHPNGAPR